MIALDRSRILALALACVLPAGCGGPGKEKAAPPGAGTSAPGAGGTSEEPAEVAGIPVYPGARYMERLSQERNRIGHAAALTGMATRLWIYYTDDPVGKVMGWYADKLGMKPIVTEFDLGRLDKLRMGERGKEAHFTLAPLREGREGARSLAVSDRDIQLPPGGVKPGERVRVRIVDKTTIRIVETSSAPGRRAPGEEPAR